MTTGILLMVVAGLCFVLVSVLVRRVGTDLSAPQAAFIRYLFGTLMLASVVFRIVRRELRVNAPGVMLVRGVAHGLGVIFWFFAMARIPMAEVTAIGYLTPVIVTVAAAVFLGERLQARRLIAVIIGFVGVLVILRPGFQTLSIGQFAQLATTPLFALSFILTKKLTNTDSNAVIVAVLSLVCTVTLFVPAVLSWSPVSFREYVLLFLTAGFATLGHFTLTHAYRCAPIAALQPVTYMQLIWATLLGVVLFGDVIDIYVVALLASVSQQLKLPLNQRSVQTEGLIQNTIDQDSLFYSADGKFSEQLFKFTSLSV